MKEIFWNKFNYFTGIILILPLFGFIVLCANIEIKDLDLWLHLKTGQYILQNKIIPAVDVLSCSIAGKPWINHEWLFQVVVHSIFDSLGPDGLIGMQVGVIFLTFSFLLFLGYRRDRQFAVVLLLLLITLVYQTRFTIRPDIFSLLFFVLYFWILSFHLNKRWSLYAFLFVQILWSNLHGFFFLGPLVILIFVIAEWSKRHFRLPYHWNQAGKLEDNEYSRLKWILGIVTLACLVNPYTFKGAWYPIGVMLHLPGEAGIFFERIQELQPPVTWATLFSAEKLPYKILVMLSSFSFFLNRKKIDPKHLLLWLFFLLFSLVAVRNSAYFSVVAYIVCLANVNDLFLEDILPVRFIQKKFHYLSAVICKFLLMIFILHLGYKLSFNGYFDFDKFERKSEFGGISQRNYPAKAADFLVDNKIRGNFFNDFNSGAYLVGRTFPEIKVFIDGRTEVYGARFFKNYMNIWQKGDAGLFETAETKYDLTGAFLNSARDSIPQKILQYLQKRKDWILVYLDYDAAVFLKDIPENKAVIKKYALDLSRWKVEKMDLRELGPLRIIPYRYINRAYTLESLGYDDAALAEISEALRVTPRIADAYKLKGKIYGKKEENLKAFENFRIAAILAPSDFEARLNLAFAYEKLKDFKHAILEYRKIVYKRPDEPRTYFRLSRAYTENKQYEKAVKTLQKAHRLAPDVVKDIFTIADMLYQAEAYPFALQAYELALTAGKSLAKAHEKIGLTYRASGKTEEARQEFEKALTIEPQNEPIRKYLRELTEK